jgi:hypothetical protein
MILNTIMILNFGDFFLNMTYFDEDFLNIYLCNNILQHFLGQI